MRGCFGRADCDVVEESLLPEGETSAAQVTTLGSIARGDYQSRQATSNQWEFQDPRMEVLYHIRPYFGGIFPLHSHSH